MQKSELEISDLLLLYQCLKYRGDFSPLSYCEWEKGVQSSNGLSKAEGQ